MAQVATVDADMSRSDAMGHKRMAPDASDDVDWQPLQCWRRTSASPAINAAGAGEAPVRLAVFITGSPN
jgi:hypothetical protein